MIHLDVYMWRKNDPKEEVKFGGNPLYTIR